MPNRAEPGRPAAGHKPNGGCRTGAGLQKAKISESGGLSETVAKTMVQLHSLGEAFICCPIVPDIPLHGAQMVEVTCFSMRVTEVAVQFQRPVESCNGLGVFAGQIERDAQITQGRGLSLSVVQTPEQF